MVEQKMFVKAVDGRRVKDPYSLKLLAPEGEWKPRESYWMRRVLFGDCIECAPADKWVAVDGEQIAESADGIQWSAHKSPPPDRTDLEKLVDETTHKPTKKSKKHESDDGHGENQ